MEKSLEEVYRKVGPLGGVFHDSEIIATYARMFKYDPARKEEVLRKLRKFDEDTERRNSK